MSANDRIGELLKKLFIPLFLKSLLFYQRLWEVGDRTDHKLKKETEVRPC